MYINGISVPVAELHWQAPMKIHTVCMYMSMCMCVKTLNYGNVGVVVVVVPPPTGLSVPEKENAVFASFVRKHERAGTFFSYISCKCFT